MTPFTREFSVNAGECLSSFSLSLPKNESTSWKKQAIDLIESNNPESFSDCDLKYNDYLDTPVTRHVFYQQRIAGLTVSDAWLRLDIDSESNSIFGIHCRLFDDVVTRRTEKRLRGASGSLSKSAAVGSAENQLALQDATLHSNEEVLRLVGKTPRLCNKLAFDTVHDRIRVTAYVDARTSRIIYCKHGIFKADAFVFDPNPMVALNNFALDFNQPVPTSAYQQVILRRLEQSGFLDGLFVTTRGTSNRVRAANGEFRFRAEQQGFGEVMAYHHVDNMQAYIQSLRFGRANPGQVRVVVNGTPDDESFYNVQQNEIRLGSAGVRDYQDAEIILHEYGHAIHGKINPRFGYGEVSVNLAEGFCDYLALSATADKKTPQVQQLLATWDAAGTPNSQRTQDGIAFLRKVDTTVSLSQVPGPWPPTGRNNSLVASWASVLWEIRLGLGRMRADSLALGHLYLINVPYSFRNAALAILAYNDRAFQGANDGELRAIFQRRGISLS